MVPSADYMSGQNSVTRAMRQTLVDRLLQVHLQYHMLPETLWIAMNIVDRSLTKRVASLVKLSTAFERMGRTDRAFLAKATAAQLAECVYRNL
jgi:hypothetical protein